MCKAGYAFLKRNLIKPVAFLGAFLIPYIVCSLLFGVPVVLLEQAMGQFTRAGPSVGFAYYAPLCQGDLLFGLEAIENGTLFFLKFKKQVL